MTSRGDRQEAIYLEKADREDFYDVLGEVCRRFNWWVYAECQMTNHYHLLVETPEGNLARGMRQLNGVYTQRFNRRHKRVGHVLQGRYKAIIVEKDSYLQELARYIVLNPVRARMVKTPKDWAWSSYRASAGLRKSPAWLCTDKLLATFGRQRYRALERYRAFVAEGINQPSPWETLTHQIYLGSDAFVEALQTRELPDRDLSEIPLIQRRPSPPGLGYYEQHYGERDQAIARAYASGGYTLKEIGEHFGLHYSRISRIVRQAEEAKRKT